MHICQYIFGAIIIVYLEIDISVYVFDNGCPYAVVNIGIDLDWNRILYRHTFRFIFISKIFYEILAAPDRRCPARKNHLLY